MIWLCKVRKNPFWQHQAKSAWFICLKWIIIVNQYDDIICLYSAYYVHIYIHDIHILTSIIDPCGNSSGFSSLGMIQMSIQSFYKSFHLTATWFLWATKTSGPRICRSQIANIRYQSSVNQPCVVPPCATKLLKGTMTQFHSILPGGWTRWISADGAGTQMVMWMAVSEGKNETIYKYDIHLEKL